MVDELIKHYTERIEEKKKEVEFFNANNMGIMLAVSSMQLKVLEETLVNMTFLKRSIILTHY